MASGHDVVARRRARRRPEVGPSAKAVASANAKRAAFHADLASGQWGALEKALGAARGPPVPCDAREIRAEVKRFLRLHGQAPGSAPFLLGFRALLEAQGGRTVSVAWRVDPATLTQSGGDIHARRRLALVRLLQPPRGPGDASLRLFRG